MIGKAIKAKGKRQKAKGLLNKLKIRNPQSAICSQKGFSLLELMIAMFILIILMSVAVPVYRITIQNARETVLKENLWQMRRAIDQYSADKGKLPQSLEDLVSQGYLREKPVDPVNDEKDEWDSVMGEDPNNDGEQGLKDIKSLAEGEDRDGKKYKDY